jgi:hypothetical protein
LCVIPEVFPINVVVIGTEVGLVGKIIKIVSRFSPVRVFGDVYVVTARHNEQKFIYVNPHRGILIVAIVLLM